MFLNYLKTALRHFRGHKAMTLINIFCMAVGILCTSVIGTFVGRQYSYNRNLQDAGQQYVLRSAWNDPNTAPASTTVGPLAKTLAAEFPALVRSAFRALDVQAVIGANGVSRRETITLADTSLVSMYGFSLEAGDSRHAFRDRHSAVLSAGLANQLFGTAHAIGRLIRIQTRLNRLESFSVSAVLKDRTDNSILDNDGSVRGLFIPIDQDTLFMETDAANDWNDVFVNSYVRLRPGVQPKPVSEALRRILALHTSTFIRNNLVVTPEPLESW